MRYPPRLAHLATRAVVAAKLLPAYAEPHGLDDEEALERLDRALKGPLWEELLEAAWSALTASSRRLDEAALLEKVAASLKDHPLRRGRPAKSTPGLSALFLELDLAAGTVGDAARRALESEAGRRVARAGREEAGQLLARELTR